MITYTIPYAYLGKTPEAGTATVKAHSSEAALGCLAALRPNAILGEPWIDDKDRPAFTFDMYYGVDGVPVLHVQTPGEWDGNSIGPRCRIYLNDGDPIWANPDLPDEEKAKMP